MLLSNVFALQYHQLTKISHKNQCVGVADSVVHVLLWGRPDWLTGVWSAGAQPLKASRRAVGASIYSWT